MGALKRISASFVAYVTEKVTRAHKDVLVARPKRKPVDYATLRKSAMARYRKTLARLAK